MARGEWEQTTQFIRKASEILEPEHPMTVRQLFYRLVSGGILKNSDKYYHYVSRMMTKARLDGRIEFDWIVDRSRPEYESSVWKVRREAKNVPRRSNRADGPRLESRGSGEVTFGIEGDDLQAGGGQENSIVPCGDVCAI